MTMLTLTRPNGWPSVMFAALVVVRTATLSAAETAGNLPPGVEPAQFEAAAAYSAKHAGVSVLVMHQGRIAFERYESPATAETATHTHSGTKGFWGPVIAAMIEDGLATSFDERASVTLSEWKDDPRKRAITLRHLLELNAGLAQDIAALQGDARSTLAPDLYAHAIKLPVVTEPGQRFVYGPSCYYALGEIMKRKLAPQKKTPLEYLQARILKPIGAETGKWVHDQSGNPHIPNGAWITARNWARFGQFLLQEGMWEGKSIVSRELMRELRRPSAPNPGHGLAIWLNAPDGWSRGIPAKTARGMIYPEGEPDLFAAMGAGKNRLYIIPRLGLVVVRQSPDDTNEFRDGEFLRLLLGGVRAPRPTQPPPTTENAPVPSATVAARLQQTMRFLDKDADGKLSTAEAGDRPFFKPADENQDGVVTLEELRRFLQRRAPPAPDAKP
jgi:CubicO group peptidase (beta-lactamase class C family)